MALTPYSGLQTALDNYANRTDLQSRYGEFVALCEARIHYGSEEPPFQSDPLRIRAMEKSQFATFNAQEIALPTRYLQLRRLYLVIASGEYRELNYVAPDLFWKTYLGSSTGVPVAYTIEGENLVLGPAPDGSYTGRMLFYQGFEGLSDDADTNWLLQNAPNAYLWGTLFELWSAIRAFDLAEQAHKKFVGIINALNKADKRDRYAGPWTARADVGNP